MVKYAKVVNEETKQCEVGLGNNIEYYKSFGMTELDVEQGYDGGWYLVGYAPQKSNAEKIVEYERQIETLNNKIVRDLIVIQSSNTTQEKKNEAQHFLDIKQSQREILINKINELKNESQSN